MFQMSITVSCVQAEEKHHVLSKQKDEKKLNKREAILIDSFPIESSIVQTPKVVYRRMSRHRYVKSKPKRGAPRPKYGPPKVSRRPVKKYRGKPVKLKYGPPSSSKLRPPKSHYGPSKPSHGKRKPVYGPPKKPHYQSSYVPQEPAGFGEPPMEYNDYQPIKTYGEPPLDSYGAPLKHNSGNNGYSANQGYSYDQPAATSFNKGQDYYGHNYQEGGYQQWQKDQGFSQNDNNFAHSHKYVNKAKPFDETVFRDEPSEDYNNDEQTGSFSEFYKPNYMKELKKKPQIFSEHGNYVNRPKKIPKIPHQDEVVVGGQYAEPPARYVPKFQPSAPMYSGDDSFTAPKGFADSETAGSSVSSYVNYKNSNIAFSPQNLNDAFSIID